MLSKKEGGGSSKRGGVLSKKVIASISKWFSKVFAPGFPWFHSLFLLHVSCKLLLRERISVNVCWTGKSRSARHLTEAKLHRHCNFRQVEHQLWQSLRGARAEH